MRLFTWVMCSLLLCGQAVQAQVRSYDQMIAAGELKVAVYKDFAPYSFEDQGQPRGVDVDAPAPRTARRTIPRLPVWVFALALVLIGPVLWAMVRSTQGFQRAPRGADPSSGAVGAAGRA